MPLRLVRFTALPVIVIACLAAAPVRADTVADWHEALTILDGDGSPTPARDKARAQTSLAMFEAANAIDRRYVSYLGFPVAAERANADAAVVAAAADVLKSAFPEQAAKLQSSLDFSLGQIADGPEKRAGIAIGRAAALAVSARATSDDVPSPNYLPTASPGLYVPTDMPVLSMEYYRAKCWFLARPDEFSPTRPPALSSAAWAQGYNEVRRLGRKSGSERTPAQTAAANFWAANSPDLAMRLLSSHPGRTLVQNARLYALVAMARADATTAVTTAKYDNKFWRPITAIRNGASDGNDATSPDGAWEPLLRTPLHPEYPCGHCIQAASTAVILAVEFGENAALTFTDPTMPGASQTVTPTEYVAAVSMSRIYAGVHYRFSNEAAEEVGHRIGKRASTDFMRPLAR